MDYITPVLAAVIAVVGTLSASIYTQRSALRGKRMDFDQAQAQRKEDREIIERKAWLEQRRACYVALNIAIRQYHAAIADLLHGIRDDKIGEEVRADLAQARRSFIERHAEAQMTAPREVLVAAGAVRGHLSSWYGLVRRLDQGIAHEGETLDTAFANSERFWERIECMRTAMRSDLGIVDASDEPSELKRNTGSE
ncbi:hypothetical protein ACFOY2_39620 [Nonomuraea purpurea]|uniref:DUF4760 domain-containing protein n=1 Tax=Nonomuraea purpurea TaxID=1849276 RepID=A0ABV8GKS3_9ACTN